MPRSRHSVRINVADMPAALYQMRRKLAELLRRAAEHEPEGVARRLREIADLFEAGMEEEVGDERE